MARVREVEQSFDPRRISPSRVEALNQCGVAFRLKYVDGMPEEVSGSAALFGSVVHQALEWWAPDRSKPLLELMRNAWPAVGGDTIAAFLQEYQPLSGESIREQHKIKEAWAARGKESKAPWMTADYKKSDVAKKINRLLGEWLPRLEEGSHYRFTERDPLARLYDDSLVLAKRYEARWQHLPHPLHTEFKFEVPWRGFTLIGYIDTVEPLLDRETKELVGVGVIDYKTYGKAPAEFKDWRQLVIYDVAFNFLIESGQLRLPVDVSDIPVLIGVDYVRWQDTKDWEGCKPRRFWAVGPEDHDRLERELNAYANTVEGGNYLPAEKGRNPDFCPFPSQCCLRFTAAAGGSCERVEVNL